jgi:hypothetical protein
MTHLKPRTATIVLYQGDDMDQVAQLKREVDIAERKMRIAELEHEQSSGTARAGDDTSDDIAAAEAAVGAARDAFDAFVDDAAGRALSVELRTIGRRRFRDLLAEHPPRLVKRKVHLPQERVMGEEAPPPLAQVEEDAEHEDDREWGVNSETFSRALLAYRDGDIVTIGAPEFADRAAVERFIDDEVSEGDFDGLWQAAYLLNRTGSQDPKALAHWASGSRSTDET